MNKNYIILAHDNPDQLERLINCLSDQSSYFYIHIDKKSNIDEFEFLREKARVHILEKRIECVWGDISIVDATLTLLEVVLASNHGGVIILLSGRDYPIVSNESIDTFFENNRVDAYIDCIPVDKIWKSYYKRLDWYKFNITSRRGDFFLLPPISSYRFPLEFLKVLLFKGGIKLGVGRLKYIYKTILRSRVRFPIDYYGGSQWFALSYKGAEMLINFVSENPSYYQYHKYTFCPDEIFFHTIVKFLECNRDNFLVRDSVTYVNWSKVGVPLPVTFQECDFGELMNARKNKIFARKLDIKLCATILNRLEASFSNKF